MHISTRAKLISTAFVAAALAIPAAHGAAGSYPQLRTGEGFSFAAPSYWSVSQTPAVRINRSLGVPALYLGSGVETQAPATMNRSLEVPAQYLPSSKTVAVTTASGGFDWLDAGIGAAFVAGLGILGVVGLLAVRRRHGMAQLEV